MRMLLVLAVALASSGQQASLPDAAQRILGVNCEACHGASQTSGLDLRERASALKGGNHGPAIVPGNAAQSLLYRAVLRDGPLKMPPGPQGLTSQEVETIRSWIESGAAWAAKTQPVEASWWSFRKIRRPSVPQIAGASNPIDSFILAKLEEKGLRPAPPAERRTLIRRITLDLTGLPPSPEEIQAFVADPSHDAYEKLVDALLASPRYGERRGRQWLDVVRYADTGGFETDIYFPNAWRYRDYLIKSFNEDKPFNRLVAEQIAGDELFPGDIEYEGSFDIPEEKLTKLEARIGTGMYTVGPVYHEAALFAGQERYEWLTDVVDTTGEAFMGVTLGCARCHDHKFDPFTKRDYHAMMAIFAGSEQREVAVVPNFSVYGYKSGYPAYLRVLELKSAVERIDQRARQRVVEKVRSHFSAETLNAYDTPDAKRTASQRTLAATLEKALTEAGLQENAEGKEADIPYTAAESAEKERLIHELGKASLHANPVLETATILGHSDAVPEVYLTNRGDWRSKGEKVAPAFPAVLASGHEVSEPSGQPLRLQRRSALANWLTDPQHPLTARVIVNRVWQWNFGRGIVDTPNDFGRQGDPPSHPELLDWLASEFVAQGWSIKKLERMILLSEAYKRASSFNQQNAHIDADNKFLWRMNRRRMDAEAIRDSVLAISGKLNFKMGGRPVIPPLSKEEYSVMWARNQWPETLDPAEQNRRSVYLYVKRTFPLPMLSTFDEPDTSVSCGRRDNTTVAPQALTLMNGEFMVSQASAFAARLRKEFGPEPQRQVEGAWNLAFGRLPTVSEKREALVALSNAFGKDGLARLCLVLLNTNEFLYVD